MFNQSPDFLIGELLLKAGLINKAQLDEALKLAGNKHMQIGQMLIMARRITPRNLQAAIDAQSAVRDRVMETNAAIKALKLSCNQGISFHEACQQQPPESSQSGPTNRLGELLIGANLTTSEQLAHAMQRSMATGLPLGRMLVLSGVINETILSVALDIQIRLRDGDVTREEAIAHLRAMSGAKASEQAALTTHSDEQTLGIAKSKPLRKTGIRLGELLVLTGVLSEMDVMNALEVSLVKEKHLGEVLVEHGYITEEYCQMALKLQSMIDSGSLDCQQAAESLKSVLGGNVSLAQAVEHSTGDTATGIYIDFQNLIIESQLLAQQDIQAAVDLALSNPRLLTKILVMTGYLDEPRAEIILSCYDGLVGQKVEWNDCLNMLAYSWQQINTGEISVDQLLEKLHISRQVDSEFNTTFSKDAPNLDLPSVTPTANPARTTTEIPAIDPLQIYNDFSAEQIQTNLQSVGPAEIYQENKNLVEPEPQYDTQPTQNTNESMSQSSQTQNVSESLLPSNQIDVARSGPQPLPRNNNRGIRTGKTTTNVPAINPLFVGSELIRVEPPPMQKNPINQQLPLAKQSLSLKGLLTGQEVPVVKTSNTSPIPSNGKNPKDMKQTLNDLKPYTEPVNQEHLNLSDEEKKLIELASSLVASPEDIMAAMKLVIQKEKSLWQKTQVQNKE